MAELVLDAAILLCDCGLGVSRRGFGLQGGIAVEILSLLCRRGRTLQGRGVQQEQRDVERANTTYVCW